jgi:hypothetical protein
MARPIKNYCDYFPHDRDMRNHRKVKAIRTKFGVVGYAIWSMTLEYLTGIDGNVLEYSDVEFELMAGDFGVSATEIRDVLDYCIKLEMLFLNNGFINSESLDERLVPVYEKRGRSKDNSKKQQRVNGKFVNNNTVSNGVSATEMPQSKVNKSKVKETIPRIDEFLDYCKKNLEQNKLNYELYEYSIKSKYDTWVVNGWKDGHNKQIKDWKGKIRNTIPFLRPIQTLSNKNGGKYQNELETARNAFKPISE